MAAKTWIGWTVALAAAVGLGPILLGRGDPQLQGSHEEISRMSEVERAVLQRKYDQYRAMSEAERAKLREMHRLLEADRNEKALHVAVLQDYCTWVKTIDAWEQDDLAHLSDPQAKVQRVSEIVQQRKAEAIANVANDEPNSRPGPGEWMPPVLRQEELTRMFDAWAKRLVNLSSEEQKEIDDNKGLKRYGIQIRHLKKNGSKSDAVLDSINDAEFKEMAEATGHQDLLKRVGEIWEPGRKRMFARLCIVASCVAQFQREGAATSDAVLQRYFDTLPKEEQDTLLQFGASEFKSQLRLQQLEQDPDIKELNSLTPNFSAAKLMMKRMAEGRPFFQPGENGGLMGPPRDREGGPRYDLRREGDRPGRPGNDRPGPRFGEGPRPPRPGDRPGEPPREGESRPPPPDENGPQ